MKGFFAGIVLTAPITALLLYVSMAGRQETVSRIERQEVRQQLQAEEFDAEFDRAWRDLRKIPPEARSKAEERRQRIASLRERQEQFDAEFDRQYTQTGADTRDLREVLETVGEGKRQ